MAGHARSLRIALTSSRKPLSRPLSALTCNSESTLPRRRPCARLARLLDMRSSLAASHRFERRGTICPVVWVTFDKADARSLHASERVVYAYGPHKSQLEESRPNGFLAWRVLRRMRPKVIVTTGAGVAVPVRRLGRLLGAKVAYVESLSRIDAPSLSCRMIAPVAHRIYAQWPDLAIAMPRARYVGSIFAGL